MVLITDSGFLHCFNYYHEKSNSYHGSNGNLSELDKGGPIDLLNKPETYFR